MGSYEHAVYLNDLEAEVLLGFLAAACADEAGREVDDILPSVREQLYRIVGGA